MSKPYVGVSDEYDLYEITLDSICTDTAANSNVTSLNWPLFQIGGRKPLSNIVGLKVLEAYIPATYYIFNSGNNVFTLKENTSSYTITIPVGNYTSSQMCTTLGNILTAGSGTFAQTYTVTYSAQTMKFTITANSNDFSLVFGNGVTTGPTRDDGNSNPRLWLGFNTGTSTSTSKVLTGQNVALLSGPDYIFINSREIGNQTNNYLPTGAIHLGGGNMGPQLACIPVNVEMGGIVFYNDSDTFHYFNVENITPFLQIDLYLTLGHLSTQMPLDLNGASFKVKLALLIKTYESIDNSTGVANGHITKRIRYT